MCKFCKFNKITQHPHRAKINDLLMFLLFLCNITNYEENAQS